MREILFRGKRKDNDEWVEGWLMNEHIIPKEQEFTVECRNPQYFVDTDKLELYEIIPSTIGQYTGLTDKNGTKIFEGDVIQSIESGETGEIQYVPEHTAFLIFVMCSVVDSSCYFDYLGEVKPSILKVIGNVHDNPELLNK